MQSTSVASSHRLLSRLLIEYCAADERIYIEHRYLYDAEDIRQQKMGGRFLEQHPMADLELVYSCEVYHSHAEVIDGERLTPFPFMHDVQCAGSCAALSRPANSIWPAFSQAQSSVKRSHCNSGGHAPNYYNVP